MVPTERHTLEEITEINTDIPEMVPTEGHTQEVIIEINIDFSRDGTYRETYTRSNY